MLVVSCYLLVEGLGLGFGWKKLKQVLNYINNLIIYEIISQQINIDNSSFNSGAYIVQNVVGDNVSRQELIRQ